VKPQPRDPRTPLTTRREALSLYRAVRLAACMRRCGSSRAAFLQVLRASPLFVWRNEAGVPWRDVIRDSARTEFNAARRAQRTRARAHAHANPLAVRLRCTRLTRTRTRCRVAATLQVAHRPRGGEPAADQREGLPGPNAGNGTAQTHTQKTQTQHKALSLLLTHARAPRCACAQFLKERQRIMAEEEAAAREGRPPGGPPRSF
jgi:hypothetical protein